MKWISVKEKGNPKKQGFYIVYQRNDITKIKTIQLVCYGDCEWLTGGFENSATVTHWMPLPKKPK